MARLCLLDEQGAKAGQWELGEAPLSVGRGDESDVVIEDEALSRRHFEIIRKGPDFLVVDLNSQNGTWVDGKPAHTTKLRHHDCILAGRTLFLFDSQQRVSGDGAQAVR